MRSPPSFSRRPKGIATWLEPDTSQFTLDELDIVAEHFGVSPFVIRYQVENQVLLRS